MILELATLGGLLFYGVLMLMSCQL